MARKAKGKNVKAEVKHARFVAEYLLDYNGTRAYKAVYGEKLEDSVAAAAASRLLRDVKVRARIDDAEKHALDDLGLRARRILREQARVAFVDPANLIGEDGKLKDLNEMDVDTRAAIASVEVFEEYQGKGKDREFIGFTKKVKLWDKNAAGANLMKHKGLFKADNDQKGDVIREFMNAVSGHSRGLPGRFKQ
jgi:phage terminase small subunit